VLDSMNAFTNNGYQWWQVAELGYDSFMARNAQS
jgi:TRAP-type mannitol/chloroaromatic compound transport system substrate-binding protein